MTKPEPTSYTYLPSEPPQQSPRTYVILPNYPHQSTCLPSLRRFIFLASSLLLLSLLIYALYPSDPELRLVRVKLNHIRIHHRHRPNPPALDLSLSVTLRVKNRDFFSLSYSSLTVAISYRGRKLGLVQSDGGKIKAKQSSYINATLDVNGFEILHDFIYLIEDFAAGSVPFDTLSSVDAHLGLFFLHIPIKAKVSCEVDVNPFNQKIIHQNCYPELLEAPSPSSSLH